MKKPQWVIGIDEVGRGPLAGPVTVCAVAMPYSIYKKTGWLKNLKGLNDSKQMTALARERCFEEALLLKNNAVIRYSIVSRTATQIDTKGIAVCIRACIAENLKKLSIDPRDCMVLLDGSLKAPLEYIHQQTIIKGDSKERIISLASVIAKVQRDEYMTVIHKKYPLYNWAQNKGYGTKSHREVLKKQGITSFHRQSFLHRIIDK